MSAKPPKRKFLTKPTAGEVRIFFFILVVPMILGLIGPVDERMRESKRFIFQMDAEEGFILNQAKNVGKGISLYPSLAEEPYLVGNYPPLYPWLISVFSGSREPDVLACRYSLHLFAYLIGYMLIRITWRRTGRYIPAILVSFLFFATYEFHNWIPFCRVDIPALMFTLLGLHLYFKLSTRRGAVLSALAFVAAAYTKQTALLAPLACAFGLLVCDRRRLAWFLVPWLGLGFGLFLLLNILTHGEFYRHLVVYNRNEMNWDAFRAVMKNEIWYFYRWWIIALLGGAAFRLLSFFMAPRPTGSESSSSEPTTQPQTPPSPTPQPNPVLAIYFALAALSLFSFAKAGSAPNYALEPLAAAALFGMETFGILMNQCAGGTSRRRNLARISHQLCRENVEGLEDAGLSRSKAGAGILQYVKVALREKSCRFESHARLQQKAGENCGLARAGVFFMAVMLTGHAIYLASTNPRSGRRIAQDMFSSPNPNEADRKACEQLLALAKNTPGEVLSEYPIYNLLAGKEVWYQPFIMSRLASEGLWDERKFEGMLDRRRFALVITAQDLRRMDSGEPIARFTPGMVRAILRRYRFAEFIAPENAEGLRQVFHIWIPIVDNLDLRPIAR